MPPTYIVVLITAKDRDEARAIADKLVNEKLAACVNIVPGVTSLFHWEGKVDQADEVLLIAKSTQAVFQDLARAVKEVHSYDCPEIIALPVIEGNEDYLKWVLDNVKK